MKFQELPNILPGSLVLTSTQVENHTGRDLTCLVMCYASYKRERENQILLGGAVLTNQGYSGQFRL